MIEQDFFVVAPSTLAVDEPFALKVKVLGRPRVCPWTLRRFRLDTHPKGPFNRSPRGLEYMDNTREDWRGTVRIDGGEALRGPDRFDFADAPPVYPDDERPIATVEGFVFAAPGVHVIRVVDEDGREGESNPVLVTAKEPDERLYWGDIHCQTVFTDGLRLPEELYAFARDEAFLDAFALSDHSDSLNPYLWNYFADATRGFHDPHRFVTFLGLEWTDNRFGHRNVYYPGDEGPNIIPGLDGELDDIYRIAKEHRALVIPHHSANARMGVDWSLGHAPEVERLVEMYSIWGNSERPAADGNPRPVKRHGNEKAGQHVVDALRMGRRYGFVGGGDIHDGRPGDDLQMAQPMSGDASYGAGFYRQGITGFWAKELTRESLWDALWSRRVYATSNIRPVIRFSVNGHPMGSETTAGGGANVIEASVASEVPLGAVEVVKDGETLRRLPGEGRRVEATFEDAADGPAWYYLRVERADGELAWASPVWVDPR